MTNKRKTNVTPGRQGFQKTEKAQPRDANLSASASDPDTQPETNGDETIYATQLEKEFALLNTEGGVKEHFGALSASLALDPYTPEDEAVRLHGEYVRLARARMAEIREPAHAETDPLIPTKLPASSRFAKLQTREDIERDYEILTSPENISGDGEIPRSTQEAIASRLYREATQRLHEVEGH